jgi:hypothetical protein
MPFRLMRVINRITPMTATVYWTAIISKSWRGGAAGRKPSGAGRPVKLEPGAGSGRADPCLPVIVGRRQGRKLPTQLCRACSRKSTAGPNSRPSKGGSHCQMAEIPSGSIGRRQPPLERTNHESISKVCHAAGPPAMPDTIADPADPRCFLAAIPLFSRCFLAVFLAVFRAWNRGISIT